MFTLRDGYCGELPEKADKVVARIGDRCDQLTSKITDIIHLSNLKSLVVTEADLVPVDLVDLLSSEAKEGDLMGEQSAVSVTFQTTPSGPTHIKGSRPHLQTLFSNLIRNPIQYSHRNGEVEVSLATAGDMITACISDRGIGIPEENLGRIFEEYFRSTNAVAHFQGGTGLGLPIVREIARLHGASVHVESEDHKGTRFFVSFDLLEAKQ